MSRARGFSLIEMLITLALVLVLSSLLMNRGSRSRQQREMTSCRKNLQSIFSALSLSALDNNGTYPMATNATTSEAPLSQLVPKCTTATEIFICPGSKDAQLPSAEPFADRKISYAYYMGWSTNITPESPLLSDRQIDTKPRRKEDPTFSSTGEGPGSNHHKYGGNVLFASGEAQKSSPKAAFDLLYPTNITFLNPKP